MLKFQFLLNKEKERGEKKDLILGVVFFMFYKSIVSLLLCESNKVVLP